MKRTLTAAALSSLTLAACSNQENSAPIVGMANPASVFCQQQGGKSEVKKDAQGNEYALCHLPDGRVVEEWEFFHQHNK
ncbi:hemolysin [Pasteurellaceae bacterium RH1A]|nr:hemolysin [Pasteurellaceae bacterium RH1A]